MIGLTLLAGVLVIAWLAVVGDQTIAAYASNLTSDLRQWLKSLPGRCKGCGLHTATQGHDERCTAAQA